jgi:ssDNA-binding Zn-finger/Zn-ribbon topoisomerase 1
MQQQGMLRRTADPEPELMRELLQTALSRFRCTRCEQTGLTAEEAEEDDDEEWDDARTCTGCRQPMARERLELYPDSSRCAACEQAAGQESQEEVEYCPRCGSPMELRAGRGSGISKYEWVCSSCRR